MSTWFATCPKGLEYLLRDELAALGADDAREALAGVHFEGPLEIAYRACLWSRLASRVLLPLAEFPAADDEALYRGVQSIDWSRELALSSTLAVDAATTLSALAHTQFLAQRVKDAVVDQFRRDTGERPEVDTAAPDLRINLRLRHDRATVSIDLAGAPLHRRLWREVQGAAPLKENLAAAMLLRAHWPETYAAGGILMDPMCGSGTLLVEGAWMAADVAPGLRRERFGFHGWLRHDAGLWQRVHEDAERRAEAGLRALRSVFFGADIDPAMIHAATRNAQNAGVAGFFTLQRQELKYAAPPAGAGQGLLITNPPYGERLGDRAAMPLLYRELGEVLRAQFAGWSAAILAGDAELARALRLHADKRYVLYNGALETTLLVCSIRQPDARAAVREAAPLSAGAEMLRNRLEKNLRRLRKRVAKEAIYCWRVYDQDLPEYAAAIDVYADVGGLEHLHVQEYRAPSAVPPELARSRMREIARVAGEVLGVPRERIALKTRERGTGGARYGKFDERGEYFEVEEGGLRFLINLTDYLDTGLFLDHRLVRAKVRELAAGQRFLNLFAYTASASVYAAAGGALETTSVDLSAPYLDWASKNLALNGFSGSRHRLMQYDALEFLRRDHGRYGLIFVDPPTFSNSKRAGDFSVQRDHVKLLLACAEHLAPGGVIVFSNNFRRFRLDQAALDSMFDVEDWTVPSIPFDFERRRGIHRCWLLRTRGAAPGGNPWDAARIKS